MNKRRFLGSAAAAAMFPMAGVSAAEPTLKGPGLLTVSGTVGKSNRGPIDPAFDQLFARHGVKFDKACVLDAEALHSLPAIQIRPTLEYDARPHSLAGPLLTSVLEAAGLSPDGNASLLLRAVDGYAVPLSLADARAYRMLVATEIDGTALALGSLGPLWAIHDADSLAAFKDKPLKERFALCPWGLYSIEVAGA